LDALNTLAALDALHGTCHKGMAALHLLWKVTTQGTVKINHDNHVASKRVDLA
jgi:hypothetical protein